MNWLHTLQDPGKNKNEGPLVLKAGKKILLKLLKYKAFLFLSLTTFALAYAPFPHWASLTKFKNTIFEFKHKQVKNTIIENFKTMTVEH